MTPTGQQSIVIPELNLPGKRSQKRLAPIEGKHSLGDYQLKNNLADRNKTPQRIITMDRIKPANTLRGRGVGSHHKAVSQ